MEHKKVQDKIYQLLDGEVALDERKQLLNHIRGCPECQGEYEVAQKLNSLYRSLPEVDLPHGYYERLYAKLPDEASQEPQQQKEPWWKDLLHFFEHLKIDRRFALVVAMIFACFLIGITFVLKTTLFPVDSGLTVAYGDAPVEVYDSKKADWEKTAKTSVLKQGDLLRSDEARVVIALDTSNSVRIAPETQVKVARLLREKEMTRVRLQLDKGRVWVDEEEDVAMQVETDRYLIDPVGTAYEVYNSEEGETLVSCYEGEVKIEIKDSGRTVDLEKGERFVSRPEKEEQEKLVFVRQIEKINADKLEKDEWFQWNRRIQLERIRRNRQLSMPIFRRKAPPPPAWFQRQRGGFNARPLRIPRTPGEWKKFHENRRKWRQKFGPGRGPGHKKMPGAVPGDLPGTVDKTPTFPGKTPGKLDTPLSGEEAIIETLPDEFSGQLTGEDHPFASLPPPVRMNIISKLKQDGKLPENYPGNADQLPIEVEDDLRRLKKEREKQLRKRPGKFPQIEPGESEDTPGQFPSQAPDSGNLNRRRPGRVRRGERRPPFETLPPEVRKRIIQNLKRQGKLPGDYPDDATSLPFGPKRQGGGDSGSDDEGKDSGTSHFPGEIYQKNSGSGNGGSIPPDLQDNEETTM